MSKRQWHIEAEVMPKQGVNDPQGEAIKGGLDALGFDGIERVRSGKVIRIVIAAANADDARNAGIEMCEKLLANPVIEEYSLTVSAVEEPVTR